MPRYEFTSGQVLTAAELNGVSDQTVMTFAGTAARGSAIPTPVEGMVTYLADSDELQVYTTDWSGITGGILQVVSANKTDTFTTTSTSFVDVTGMSVSITPRSTSSKILVLTNFDIGSDANAAPDILLLRGSTSIFIGDAAGSRTRTSKRAFAAASNTQMPGALQFLDSPSTTSSVTYKIQLRSNSGSTVTLNRSIGDADNATTSRSASSITVMEVAG